MQRSRTEIFNLRRDLSELGWKNLKHWSDVFDFRSDTVRKTVSRYWCADAKPGGGVTSQILILLEDTLKLGIRPQETEIFFEKLSMTVNGGNHD